MDKIATISVRDISKVSFAQIMIAPFTKFFTIFACNIQDARKM